MKPLVFVNFKTYPEALGENGIELAREIAHVKTNKYTIVIAPTFPTLQTVVNLVHLPVFAQHTDPVTSGAHTGSISGEELKAIRVQGTFLNHSEKPLSLKTIKETIALCKKNKLKTLVFAKDIPAIKHIVLFHPDYVAYEPPELVGGNISVTTANPQIIRQAVQAVKKMNPKVIFLVGAGIQSKQDIQTALRLGAQGVVLAHAIVQSSPKKIRQILL